MKKITGKFIVFCFSLIISLGIFTITVQAKALEITQTDEYYVESADYIHVISTHVIKNNSSDSSLRKDNTDTFVISHLKNNSGKLSDSAATVKVTCEGQTLTTSVKYDNDYAYVTVSYPHKVSPGGSLKLTMEYNNYGLIEHSGILYDIYVPGIAKDTVFEEANQSLAINTFVYTKDSIFPELNFVLPAPAATSTTDSGLTRYYFNSDSLLGSTVWIQRGREQYYQFKITQEVKATMSTDLGFENDYALVLPRDVDDLELYQKVYIDQILPTPDWIETDSDGNVIAHFKVSSAVNSEITVSGYVEVGVTEESLTEANSGKVSDYSLNFAKDLKAAEYWEVTDPKIVATAKDLLGSETNVYKILKNTFSFVTGKINYSEVKLSGLNARQGALETLLNGSGVCMEYSDLFLTLARAQGIPTRAVFGYGFDPRESTTDQQPHQWVASYIPTLSKWYDLDVTWGDIGQVGEGGNLNHFYTHIVSNGPDSLSDVSANIYGSATDIASPDYAISAVTEIPSDSVLLTQGELLAKYPGSDTTTLMTKILRLPVQLSARVGSFVGHDTVSIILMSLGGVLVAAVVIYNIRQYRKDPTTNPENNEAGVAKF